MRRVVVALAAGLLALMGCDSATPSSAPPSSPTTSAPAPVHATPAPRPKVDRCYRLTYEQAVAATTDVPRHSCRHGYTARTFYVGRLPTLVLGHLLAVDSPRVQDAVAASCTHRLAGYLHGSADTVALSMFRAIWFSPTVEQSDQGQEWYRCDVTALARDGQLDTLHGDVAGSLGASGGLDRWGTCGTAEPGTATFARVICASAHSWREIAVVQHGGHRYPGAHALTADRNSCEDPARSRASDPLHVVFSYLAPTREQWLAGQHYGTCWVPTT